MSLLKKTNHNTGITIPLISTSEWIPRQSVERLSLWLTILIREDTKI